MYYSEKDRFIRPVICDRNSGFLLYSTINQKAIPRVFDRKRIRNEIESEGRISLSSSLIIAARQTGKSL